MNSLGSPLARARLLLAKRLEALEARVHQGDEGAWSEYAVLVLTLATIEGKAEGQRPMLTTAEMASRLGVAPKTLLRHKAAGKIRPALSKGKLLRWSGRESLQ